MDIFNSIMNSLLGFKDLIISNISNTDSIIKFVVIYFFILWGAFVIWIVKDITNRTTNIFLQSFSILIVIFLTPIFGLPIYLLMRPRSTIFEKYYEEDELIEEELLEEDLEGEEKIEKYSCPKCFKEVNEEFKFCPYCELKLTKDCTKCNKHLRVDWKICPYCGYHQEQDKIKKDGMKIEVEKIEKKKKIKEDILSELENS